MTASLASFQSDHYTDPCHGFKTPACFECEPFPPLSVGVLVPVVAGNY